MPALKNDKFREYTRYAEYCLNMVVSTRDQELRCAQREMAAEYAFQGPQRPHFVTKQRMRSCCFALGTDEMAMVSLRLIASVTGTE
jgi:hypothetical protein